MRWNLPTKASRWFAWYPVVAVIQKLDITGKVSHCHRKMVWLEFVDRWPARRRTLAQHR